MRIEFPGPEVAQLFVSRRGFAVDGSAVEALKSVWEAVLRALDAQVDDLRRPPSHWMVVRAAIGKALLKHHSPADTQLHWLTRNLRDLGQAALAQADAMETRGFSFQDMVRVENECRGVSQHLGRLRELSTNPTGCSTCPLALFRFNNGNGATTCAKLGHRIVSYGHRALMTRPADCPLGEAE
jgi:hypothetical protein